MKRILPGRKTGFRNEGGQTLILVVASMVVLMGFLGLAIDVGLLRTTEHKLQQAADAAALAGALELSYCNGTLDCTAMTTAAQKSVSENSITGATLMTQCTGSEPATGFVVMVNNGPCLLSSATDPNYGSAKVVEAQIIEENTPTYFARVLGLTTVRLSARAEAGRGPFPYCFGANIDATVVNGAQINASCSGQDNGNLTLGNGSSTKITTTGFNYDGTLSGSTAGMTPPPTHGGASLADPLAWLSNNDLPQCGSLTKGCVPASTVNGNNSTDPCDNLNIASSNSGSFTWDSSHSQWDVTGPVYVYPSNNNPANNQYSLTTANPAYANGTGPVPQVNICGNIYISNGGALLFANSSSTLEVFNGNITSAANAGTSYTLSYTGANNVTTTSSANNVLLGGSNVTMYFSNGSIGDEHSNNVLVAAPATGPYEGVLYYAPPTNTSSTLYIASGANSSWQGIVYDPNGTVDVSDGGNLAAYQFFWAGHLILDHGAGMTVKQDFSSLAGGSPIEGVTAVLSE